MRGKALVGGVAGIMMLAAAAADSAELTAFSLDSSADLAALCGAEPGDPEFGDARQFCFGFISGVSLFYTTALRAERIRKAVCTDEQLTREQLRANFVAWQSEHPEYADASPLDGFVRSVVNRWPCEE